MDAILECYMAMTDIDYEPIMMAWIGSIIIVRVLIVEMAPIMMEKV